MDHAHALDNNLALYQAVLDAHGITGTLDAHVWFTTEPVPPYYSHLLTRSGLGGIDAQMARLGALAAAPPASGWTFKDGFATLDADALRALGLHPFLEGRWYGLPAGHEAYGATETDLTFAPVTDSATLAQWEAVWTVSSPTDGVRVFPDACLQDVRLVFLTARDARGTLVGGVLANLSREAVGVSNVFCTDAIPAASFARDAVRAVARRHPDRHVVGYELGEGGAALHPLAPVDLGPLRIYRAAP